MNIFFSFLALVLFCSSSESQVLIQPVAGILITRLDSPPTFPFYKDKGFEIGYIAGINIRLGDRLFIESGLHILSQQNTRVSGGVEMKVVQDFLLLRILGGIKFLSWGGETGLSIDLHSGISPKVQLHSAALYTPHIFTLQGLLESYKKFNIGFVIGTGITYSFLTLIINAEYDLLPSLTETYEIYQVSNGNLTKIGEKTDHRRFITIGATLGARIPIR